MPEEVKDNQKSEIFTKVKEACQETIADWNREITAETKLDDLGMDEIDILDAVMNLEDTMDVDIDGQPEDFRTVQDICTAIEKAKVS